MLNIVLLSELANFTKFLVKCAKDKKAWSKEALKDLEVVADMIHNIFLENTTNVEIATLLLQLYAKYDVDTEKIKQAQPFKSLLGV